MSHTLILNADYSPVSVLPMSSLCWQDAMKALSLGSIQVLHAYDNWTVNSPRLSFAVPAVAVLREYRKVRRAFIFSDDMVKLRDLYVCQYCNERFPERRLTMDHVVPKSHGGPYNAANLVAACEPCNSRRGNNIRVQPRRAPYRPTYRELADKIRRFPITIPHVSWAEYIGWEASLIRVSEPLGMPGYAAGAEPSRFLQGLLAEPGQN